MVPSPEDDKKTAEGKVAVGVSMVTGDVSPKNKESVQQGSEFLNELLVKLNERNVRLVSAAKIIAAEANKLDLINLNGSDLTSMKLNSEQRKFFENNLTKIYEVVNNLKVGAKNLDKLSSEHEADIKAVNTNVSTPRNRS